MLFCPVANVKTFFFFFFFFYFILFYFFFLSYIDLYCNCFHSPSELNSSKRIAEKPPLIKKLSVTLESTLNLEEDLHPLVTSSSSPSPSCQTSCVTTNTSSSTTSTAVVGYVNEKVTDSSVGCVHSADGHEQHDFDNKW